MLKAFNKFGGLSLSAAPQGGCGGEQPLVGIGGAVRLEVHVYVEVGGMVAFLVCILWLLFCLLKAFNKFGGLSLSAAPQGGCGGERPLVGIGGAVRLEVHVCVEVGGMVAFLVFIFMAAILCAQGLQ